MPISGSNLALPTRRQALGRLGCGAASLALAPLLGAAAPEEPTRPDPVETPGPGFTFVVLNDLHHAEPAACDPWFTSLFDQITREHPSVKFCLALGDLVHRGKPECLAALAQLAARRLPVPFLPVPGNHDQDLEQTPRLYLESFPGRLNYTFRQDDWQFVMIDTTQGSEWVDTYVPAATLAWLDQTLPQLDRARPTVIGTHFPLSNVAPMCPLNADEVLARFAGFALRGTFSGHHHAQTRRDRGAYELVTNVCCSRVAGNHDGSVTKGYFLVHASPEGRLTRRFVPLAFA